MNPSPSVMPVQALKPIWHPPISVLWIATVLVVFFAAVVNRVPPAVIAMFTSPAGFFGTALAAIACIKLEAIPLGFTILFFLLSAWAIRQFRSPEGTEGTTEGFLDGSNIVDWVTNSKRWYVEKVLKERPLGIQEKDVNTYPVQG